MLQRVSREALKAVLAERIRNAADRENGRCAVRVRIPVEPMDSLAWLDAQTVPVKTYWTDRPRNFRMAGVGAADIALAQAVTDYEDLFDRIQDRLTYRHSDLRYYGAIRFAPDRTPGARWAPFGGYRFVMPRFELLNLPGGAVFACNLCPQEGRSLADDCDAALLEIEDLRFDASECVQPQPACVSRRDCPDRDGWETVMQDVLDAIRDKKIEKVVLARESQFAFANPLDPVSMLRRLARHTPNSYHFCFQTAPGEAFLGASPEQLYRQRSMYVRSEALAGTRPRGDTPEADARLREELLASDKDRREHRIVMDSVQRTIEQVCRTTRADDEVRLLSLPHCHHLFCAVEGLLADNMQDSDLLRALHPTPAVAGHPTPEALDAIARLEPFDRGQYAGPAGWLGYDAAEFAVAIRSGLIRGNELSLYAGAGIVEGSTADGEWAEMEAKLAPFLAAMDEDAEHDQHQ
ncbi:MAG: menaquinone-specific isochorismate synthase [Candidatus Hydrogenedentes bacterium]|nr:menaquinone-specific isochorismate synthase [Candidatus Hydrogenedentota bacterium]